MNLYFADFSEFLQMGTHGPYVWSCYFLMLTVLLVLAFIPNIRLQQLKKMARSRKASANSSRTSGSDSDHASAA
ncbi:MAG TPA: heme exporter protein CcmD [Cellvibrionaceae bacterium]|nr:heme exporter protein CcmD [Cellvibrionaceae bacterium]HMW72536.1 heme exporter protein CcmD [Cellvibrionaceae bacterium]HMY38966.1 heme exporter protein CcmD [Marinagarivorans sp.]HNG61231.1 heme exporter protein CcmD [Cellvibrionaceae bacterium]